MASASTKTAWARELSARLADCRRREAVLREIGQLASHRYTLASVASRLGVSSHTLLSWARADWGVRRELVRAYERHLGGQ